MLIEQLDENKIKVTVDTSDQEEYGVTYESMTYSDLNTRKLCECIMERAKDEVGFNINGAKLLVEARKGMDGSVTLFLSKLLSSDDGKEELYGQTVVFKTFDDLCDCNKVLNDYCEKMTVTDSYVFLGKYYLYFEILCRKKQASELLRSVLEYGDKSDLSHEILNEHGLKIFSKQY